MSMKMVAEACQPRGCSSRSELVWVWTLLCIHALLLTRIAVVNSPVIDETAHLPSGLSHLLLGNFDLYRVNPPLMRAIVAIPLLVSGPKTDWAGFSGPYDRPEFYIGGRFAELNGFDTFWMFTMCRWMQIPISILGGWLCYSWARELYGGVSGVFALALWSFCPNMLTWGATITPDIGAISLGLAANYAFWRWLRMPTNGTAVIAGVALGAAELTKTIWLILFVLWPAIAFFYCLLNRSSTSVTRITCHLCGILVLALYLMNAAYGFENSFQKLNRFVFISCALGGPDAHVMPGNRFRGKWCGEVPIPVPANYLRGIDVQKYDFERPRVSYLRGEHRGRGWYYYYIYGLCVKTPVGTIVLVVLALILALAEWGMSGVIASEAMLLTCAGAILIFVSSQIGFNRHVRYVLPAAPYVYILTSRILYSSHLSKTVRHVVACSCMAGSICASLAVFPHSMSYFNALAGGPMSGGRHLLESNTDWGQDLLELKRFIERHPEVGTIKLAYYGNINPQLARFPSESIELPNLSHDGSGMTPGWYALSVNVLFDRIEKHSGLASVLQYVKPDATAGYSIWIYHFTDERIESLAALSSRKTSR